MDKEHMSNGRRHAARHNKHMDEHMHHREHMMSSSPHKVKTVHDGHKYEYHTDNGMHEGVHEMVHGHRNKSYREMMKDGGHADEKIYQGIRGGMHGGKMSVREAERELKTSGAGRMSRQHRERSAYGKGQVVDDTVYGKLPPVPGTIDS